MNKHWSKEGVVYQIYPRSFHDSNHDGIGDIQGIIQKIPHLVNLGISIVWLSPVYASPNDDNGYDISNYYDIHPDFGTLEDMRQLIKILHLHGIKLVMDLVVNHTSDEHEWFQRSVNKVPGFADYYHWSKTKKNWTSFFGGSAWEYHPVRKEYYLHLFSKKQPDLNWDNPIVRQEVKAICRFWLDLGVDGFRCDVINIIAKETSTPQGKFALILRGKEHYLNHPKIHTYLQELKKDVFSNYDCFTVGETVFITPQIALEYIKESTLELDMVFQFEHMGADAFFVKWFIRRFKPMNLKKPLSKWQNELQSKGWNSLYLENHDQPRSISRFGSLEFHAQSAKMLATMLYFQQGTPYIYQGQEIGMTNAHFTRLDQFRDIETLNMFEFGTKVLHFSKKRMMKKIFYASRDHARTPMQWNQSEHAGFSTTTPWIEVNENYMDINVSKNATDENSILSYYQQIIALRKKFPVIVYGDYQDIGYHHPRMYCYSRSDEVNQLLVVCNFSKKPLKLPNIVQFEGMELLLCNESSHPQSRLLKPYEARVYLKMK
jgi:oligo-1,6-glucosidase